ncbi:DUF4880 domain-containing protein, partial [Azospirillum brasilense]|uniref:DUF4880 domain-containing protein n=1 Tax=Azospirillum brasilense TaxID=192 RepID=UPI00190C92AF
MPPSTPDDTDPSLPLEQALDWFIRLQAEDAGEECRRACADWCAADPRNARAWALAQDMWASPLLSEALAASTIPATTVPDSPPRRQAPAGPLRQPRRSRPLARRAMAWAAGLLVAVGLGLAADLPLRLQADHRTATGVQE